MPGYLVGVPPPSSVLAAALGPPVAAGPFPPAGRGPAGAPPPAALGAGGGEFGALAGRRGPGGGVRERLGAVSVSVGDVAPGAGARAVAQEQLQAPAVRRPATARLLGQVGGHRPRIRRTVSPNSFRLPFQTFISLRLSASLPLSV